MAAPTKLKTWRFNINRKQAAAVNATGHQQQMLDYHLALTTNDGNWDVVPTTQWSVDHCCDSSVAGTPGDGIDRWAVVADLRWDRPGDAHSWMVWNTGLNGGVCQMLVDLDNGGHATAGAQPESIRVTMSWGGLYTGGTTTNAPTATDESSDICTGDVVGEWWGGQTSTTASIAWHMLMSDDGEELRIFCLQDNVCFAAWACGAFANPPASYTKNFWGSIYSRQDPTLEVGNFETTTHWLNGNDAANIRGDIDNGNGFRPTTLGFTANTIQNLWNIADVGGPGDELETEAVFGEIICWDTDTAGKRGPKGRIKDMWAVSNGYLTGSTFPADGSRQFAKIAEAIAIPWDGATQPQNVF